MKPHKLMKYMAAEKQVLTSLSACFFHFSSVELLFNPKLLYLCLSFSGQINTHKYAMFYYMMLSIIFLFMSKLIYRENEMFNV